jgi:two-component system chemotaxis response regulator CheB
VVRILIADDSTVIRTRVASWISAEVGLELCGQAQTGAEAVELFRRLQPDLVILDIEMPDLDGIATLAQIRAMAPHVPVIMFSALTESGSQMTVTAMLAGASDYVAKPLSFRAEDETRRALLGRVRALARPAGSTLKRSTEVTGLSVSVPRDPRPAKRPDIIAVASSTGGPAALGEFLGAVGRIDLPIVVVQHIPATFLGLLVEQLRGLLAIDVDLARDGEVVHPGSIRFAPSMTHLEVHRRGEHMVLDYSDAPPVNSCRPSADVLFSSAATAAPRPVAVVLSGMGPDGHAGAGRSAARGSAIGVNLASRDVKPSCA